jgi:hypothetical protein
MYRPVRWRWALIGLALGIVCVLADLLLEWRGPQYAPWVGDGVAMNVAHMLTGVVL